MKFVVAGGGVAGLAAALAVARQGHQAVVHERDIVDPGVSVEDIFRVPRKGIPHFFQPHAFLPGGRRTLLEWAPDVYEDLLGAGADPQDLSLKLRSIAQRFSMRTRNCTDGSRRSSRVSAPLSFSVHHEMS